MATQSNASDTPATNDASDPQSSETANVAPRPSDVVPAGTNKLAPPLPNLPFDFREAHALTTPNRAAILPAAIVNPGALDVPYASKVAIGTAARLTPYRDRIAARFGDELATIDMIDTYARAATHSDVVLSITTAPPEKVQAAYEAALGARRFLYSDINNLVTLGLVASKALSDVGNEAGHINAATDIQKLVTIADKSSEAVRARMGITEDQRNEYRRLAYELTELTSRRDSGALTEEEAREDLARAVTLLVNAYGVADRVMTYLLWENGAHRDVVPSLYNNKSKGRKGNGVPEVAAPVPPTTSTTTPTEAATEEPIAPGARGGSPFGSNG